MTIPGGFYIKARCIQESWIAHSAPVVRETWDYLIREANHKPKKYNGFVVERGQLFRSYKEIREALYWQVGCRKQYYTENQMKHTMKLLMNNTMIVKTNKPRGILITICNYGYYQTISNYESTNESSMSIPMNHPPVNQSSPPINKNEKKEETPLPKKPGNPDVKFFIDYAAITFKEKFNMPLHISGGKDGSLVKSMLGTYTLVELKKLWTIFLNSDDDFIVNKAGISICIFKTVLNKLVSLNGRTTKKQLAAT